MRNAFEAVTHASGEHLAAPNGTVISIASAIETEPNDALDPGAALGKHRSNVSAVMLHGNPFDCDKFGGVDSRHILRVRIVNDEQVVRIDLIHGKQILDRFAKSTESFVVVQVSDVLADKGLAVDDESDRILEVRAQSKEGPIGRNRRRSTGSVSASAAKDSGAENADAGDRTVNPTGDRGAPR